MQRMLTHSHTHTLDVSNSNARRYNLTSVDEFSGELMKHSIIATKDGFFEANEKKKK